MAVLNRLAITTNAVVGSVGVSALLAGGLGAAFSPDTRVGERSVLERWSLGGEGHRRAWRGGQTRVLDPFASENDMFLCCAWVHEGWCLGWPDGGHGWPDSVGLETWRLFVQSLLLLESWGMEFSAGR